MLNLRSVSWDVIFLFDYHKSIFCWILSLSLMMNKLISQVEMSSIPVISNISNSGTPTWLALRSLGVAEPEVAAPGEVSQYQSVGVRGSRPDSDKPAAPCCLLWWDCDTVTPLCQLERWKICRRNSWPWPPLPTVFPPPSRFSLRICSCLSSI